MCFREMLIANWKVNLGNGCAPYGCPHKFASQINRVAIFGYLDCAKSYYPMIALNRPQAIYGLPPQPIIPNPCLPISQLEYVQEMRSRTGYQQQLLFAQYRAFTKGIQPVNAGAQLASQLAFQQQQQSTQNQPSVTGMQSENSRSEAFCQGQHIPQAPHEAETSQTLLKRELKTSPETFDDCPGSCPSSLDSWRSIADKHPDLAVGL